MARADDRECSLPPVVRQIRDWVPGDPIPKDLLDPRNGARGSCVLLPSETEYVLSGVMSVPLLLAVLASRDASDEALDQVVERLLLLAGPGRAFHELDDLAARDPNQRRRASVAGAIRRAAYPHVWVEAVSVDDDDIAPQDGLALLERVRRELELGRSMDLVYRLISHEVAYRPSAGPHKGQWRTHLGNFGDFVLGPGEAGPPIDRGGLVPPEHVRRLLASESGALLILAEPAAGRRILYQVHERYTPGRARGAAAQQGDAPVGRGDGERIGRPVRR